MFYMPVMVNLAINYTTYPKYRIILLGLHDIIEDVDKTEC